MLSHPRVRPTISVTIMSQSVSTALTSNVDNLLRKLSHLKPITYALLGSLSTLTVLSAVWTVRDYLQCKSNCSRFKPFARQQLQGLKSEAVLLPLSSTGFPFACIA